MPDLVERLQEVFRTVFAAPGLEIREGMSAKDVDGWDSLKHIELIISVQDAFGVRFRTIEVGRMDTIGDLITLLRGRLAE
jgi:acyl carrier protein